MAPPWRQILNGWARRSLLPRDGQPVRVCLNNDRARGCGDPRGAPLGLRGVRVEPSLLRSLKSCRFDNHGNIMKVRPARRPFVT
jgi:hypothetical protein